MKKQKLSQTTLILIVFSNKKIYHYRITMLKNIICCSILMLGLSAVKAQNVFVCSGECVMYKVTPIKMYGRYGDRVEFLGTAFGKVTIDRIYNQLKFYYNGKLVCAEQIYFNSPIDKQYKEAYYMSKRYNATLSYGFCLFDNKTFGKTKSKIQYHIDNFNWVNIKN